MRSRLKALSLLVCLVPFVAGAQNLEEYLQLRKKYGITRAADVEAVELFVGKRTIEVKGTVKGVIGSGDSTILLIEGPEGVQHFVKAVNPPDWLNSGSVQARLILDAERESDTSMLQATLVGAASESEVAAYEEKLAKAEAAKARAARPIKTSRKGGRPSSLPGTIPNPTTHAVGQPPAGISAELARILPAYVTFIKNRNKNLSDDDAQRIAQDILAYSAHFGLDPRLIVAIVLAESGFNPNGTSSKGAVGLGQLMPGTAKGLGLDNAYDIEQNLWGTVRLVRGHIDKYMAQTNDSFEALVLALAGYNAGGGAVKKWDGVPPYKQTQDYIRKVVAIYQQLCGK